MFKALLPALLVFSAAASAHTNSAESEKKEQGPDFFEATLGTRVEECKAHFDLKPYLQIAITGDTKNDIPPEVLENFKAFAKNGFLTIPADKAGDVVAQKCATYAEGVLVGGIGHQLLLAFALAADAAKTSKNDDAAKK